MRRQVDDDAVVAERAPGHVVAAAADRHQQVVRACELDGRYDIGRAEAPDDQPRPPVDSRIPDPPRDVIGRVLRLNGAAGQAGGEGFDGRRVDRSAAAVEKLRLGHLSSLDLAGETGRRTHGSTFPRTPWVALA